MIEISEFTSALHLAAKALQFYTAEHPRGTEALTNLDRAASALLATTPRVTIIAAKGTLIVDGMPVGGDSGAVKAHVKAVAQDLEARHLGGLILTQGLTYRELTELVRLFVMKPQQIREAGGADEILRRADVIHIRISHVRYEAITEGEEVVWSKDMHRFGGSGNEEGPESLESLLRRYFEHYPNGTLSEGEGSGVPGEGAGRRSGQGPGGREHAASGGGGGGGGEGGAGGGAGSGGNGAPGSGPTSHGGGLAGSGDAGSIDIASLRRRLQEAIAGADGLDLLRARLEELGISREQLDEIVSVIGWDKLSVAEKIEKLLLGSRIFDFPREKLIVFIRELLEARRYEEVQRLLETYVRGLEKDSLSTRMNVVDGLSQIAAFVETPGVSPQIDQLLTRVILNHFVRENDPRLSVEVADAVASLCTSLIVTGRSEVALRTLSRLESAVAVADDQAAVRQSYESLARGFSDQKRAAKIISQVFAVDAEALTKFIVPLVTHLGGALVPALIDALVNEDDRNRRGRLVRLLKAIGRPAHPFLLEALQSQTWFVVRNTLNILGDIGEPEHASAIGKRLQHGDARVRRAAARALGKIGGAEAEALLAAAINDRDAETQSEVLLCLGTMKAQSAVPALGELARSRSVSADARELAMATLGQIGSDAAVPALGEVLRPKGIFARESLAIRVAAARALAAIGTPAAQQIVRQAVAAESDRSVREALAKFAS